LRHARARCEQLGQLGWIVALDVGTAPRRTLEQAQHLVEHRPQVEKFGSLLLLRPQAELARDLRDGLAGVAHVGEHGLRAAGRVRARADA
jgi:hypothetical protein